jgi:hypothetical protein
MKCEVIGCKEEREWRKLHKVLASSYTSMRVSQKVSAKHLHFFSVTDPTVECAYDYKHRTSLFL